MLKALDSGLLLVTGPFGINGVPLRRVNARYVIGTSTSVDVSAVDTAAVTDAHFKRAKASQAKKSAEEFLAASNEKVYRKAAKVVGAYKPSAELMAAQKAVDAGVMKAVKAVPQLEKYLHARFGLRNGDKPHAMKF